ncbi:MAG TPA: PEGA domain-containing protein, partial [Vicinamibacterales bacterium]
MTEVPAENAVVPEVADGLGRRTRGIDAETGDEVERLDLAPELVENASFVAALAERVARFASVRHASYVHVRRLDRPSEDRLELVSDLTPGWRLSELLEVATLDQSPLDVAAVIGLLRQLMPAVALYSRHNRDAAIGALGPERLIVTPQARLVIAEHAFGPALEKLNLDRETRWRSLRVAIPASPEGPRVNQRTDAHGIGMVALSLLLGRVLTPDEYPGKITALVEGLSEYRDGQSSPLSASFAAWLKRALQIEERTGFKSPSEAQLAFESVLASDRSYVTSSTKLEEWVAKTGGVIDAQRRPPTPEPEPIPVLPDPVVPEAAPAVAADVPEPPRPFARQPLLVMGGLIVLLLGVVAWLWSRDTGAPRAGEGELVVQSRPVGARVTVDGTDRGVTPVTVRLSSGAHVLEVQIGKSETRVIPITIQANVQTSQYIELEGGTVTGALE